MLDMRQTKGKRKALGLGLTRPTPQKGYALQYNDEGSAHINRTLCTYRNFPISALFDGPHVER